MNTNTSPTLPVNINGSPIGAYMNHETAAHLLEQSQLLRAQVLRKRAVAAERELVLRAGNDRRITNHIDTQDMLDHAERRHNADRRFTPTPL